MVADPTIVRRSYSDAHAVSQSKAPDISGHTHTRGSHGSGVPESTPAGYCVFLADPDPKLKICEKPDPDPESLFNFGGSRSLCGHFLSENMGKFLLDR